MNTLRVWMRTSILILAAFLTPKASDANAQACKGMDSTVELAYPCSRGDSRTAVVSLADGTFDVVEYEWIEGEAVFEGDIILPSDADGNLIFRSPGDIGSKSTGRANSSYRWPGATVYYKIDPSLPNQQRVLSAISHWEAKTRIRFHQRTSQSHYVTFRPGTGCSSYVGRQGGQQFITLSTACSTGNTIHEIGHAVGLWHEQNRSDRDNSVIIHWNNIESGYDHNFKTYVQRGEDGFDLGSHDFGSIMHYGSYAFSKNGSPTITRLNGSTFSAQRSGLSDDDRAGVDYMYPIPPLQVSMSGPTSRQPNQSGTWTVSTSGGVPPYTYYWFKTYSSGSTSLGGGTSKTTSHSTSFNIVCDVIDSEGFATTFIFVDVDGEGTLPH